MKRLVVFDLDGTLTLSRETDEGFFAQSIREVLGIKSLNTDWTTYRDVTDIGVIAELIERHGLEQTAQSVQDRFITLLRSDLDETPWDVRVATNLELDFVGIGSGQQAERLLECGTKHVIEDFTDVDRFLELVAQS